MRKVFAAYGHSSAVIANVLAEVAGSEANASLQNHDTSAIVKSVVGVDLGGNERHRACSYENASTSSRIGFDWAPSVRRPGVLVDSA
jgi:hypothetical protein